MDSDTGGEPRPSTWRVTPEKAREILERLGLLRRVFWVLLVVSVVFPFIPLEFGTGTRPLYVPAFLASMGATRVLAIARGRSAWWTLAGACGPAACLLLFAMTRFCLYCASENASGAAACVTCNAPLKRPAGDAA